MHDKKLLAALILFSGFFAVDKQSFAAEIFLGITAQQSTLFISDADTLADLAEMENKLYFLPTLSARSENNYINPDSDWGYFLESNIGYYRVNRQVVNNKTIKLGTKLSGLYWDLTPTIFYNFGSKAGENWGFKAGLGIGAGYLSVSGKVVFTELAGQPMASYHDHDYGFTVGLFFEAIKDDLFFQIKGYGPDIKSGNEELQLANIKLTFGKTFSL